ncbi:hypothetical protein NLN86_22550 [Citrobacter portucalensis]|uniref:Uncharacterized protein n=1 Tax=Citrobacter portucalensis TaxID=1639133 RepID=A0AAW5WG77_9ENTR|nr:hypothetical protein [Citrobacter portucalensis]MCX9004409.1 hypothetical protein [Citrobacter portucalensis]
MKTSGGAPNVWPGYVAAVAGLGISLLLLIAVLGLGIFQIGASIHEKILQGFKPNIEGDTKLISSAGGGQPAEISDKIKFSPSENTDNRDLTLDLKSSEVARVLATSKGEENTRLLENSPDKLLAAMHNNNSLRIAKSTADRPQGVSSENNKGDDVDILFQFSDGIYKLNDEAKKMSQKIMEQHLTGYKVIVWASASVDIESASRIAYIRILAVRNYFLDSGFRRENVIVKLVPVSSDASKQNEVKVKFSAVNMSVVE